MIDGIAMKGKKIIIPFQLKEHILQQLHSNHIGIKKMKLLAHKPVYWLNLNEDIVSTVKQYGTCLGYWKHRQEKNQYHMSY